MEMIASKSQNFNNSVAIDKLKTLIDDIVVCLFCTNLKEDEGNLCSPMSVINVCDQGNIWFFSDINSDKNKAILKDKKIQLFFAHPEKSLYLVLNGEAEIILDRKKIVELWRPAAKIWFREGENDPNISIIKVTPSTGYYWDNNGNQMMNFFRIAPSFSTGSNLIKSIKGKLII